MGLAVVGRSPGMSTGMSKACPSGVYRPATLGLDHPAILRHFPRTELESPPDDRIRIWISGDSDGETRIVPAAGWGVSAAAGGFTLPVNMDGFSVAGWRVIRI